ncbi:MAG: ribonuclease R [Thermodesulfobacteriota bacterium]|nr:ribonuclease R [Thermodesulfobacteriota bacterium]
MPRRITRETKERAIQPADILAAMRKAGRPLLMREILQILSPAPQDKKFVKDMIIRMGETGELILLKEGRYGLPERMNLVTGRLQINPGGFGFVIPEAKSIEDVFIPGREIKDAIHGDRVIVRLEHGLKGRRPEGRVIRILERKAKYIVGSFTRGRGGASYVIPEDERFPFEVVISSRETAGARSDEVVVAEITNFPPGRRNPEGRIIKVLGDPDDIAVQTQMVIFKHGLIQDFSPEAEAQARRLPSEVTSGMVRGREDLRGILTVTIDGEQAKDFDDAVSIEKDRQGYNLYVSIADISHYVPAGSPLDEDAYKRSNSVYFPNFVIPMFPPILSDYLGSLRPQVERLAFTAFLHFDRQGKMRACRFYKSVIRSDARLTYTEVKGILVDKDRSLRRKYRPLVKSLEWMAELSQKISGNRRRRGSIDFDLPEPAIILGVQGALEDIVRRERNLAHQIIEEFMIAANEAVAEHISERDIPCLYRIHEEPEAAKVHNFLNFAHSLGLPITFPEEMTPHWFQKVLGLVEGAPGEYVVNTLLLRSMKQAVYAAENRGHFGLASAHYTHFTSPIRRYADLIVHRILHHALEGNPGPLYTLEQLSGIGQYISTQERLAMEAEREMVDRLRTRFMADKIGEEYDGIISAVTAFGFFVELREIFVEGVVRLVDMADDYYYYEEKHHRLVGRRKKQIFQIGDFVRVQVARVDISRRHINLVLIMKYTSRGISDLRESKK